MLKDAKTWLSLAWKMLNWQRGLQELLESVRESCSAVVSLPPAFVRDLIVDQVGTDVSNKTSAINLAVATQLSDRILDEATEALRINYNQLVLPVSCHNVRLSQKFTCFSFTLATKYCPL